MFYVYLIISAALIPISDIFFDVLREPYSWWLVPVLFIGFFLALLLIQAAVVIISIWLVDLKKDAERFSGYYRKLIDISLPMVFKLLRVEVKVTGEEKIPQDSRFLLVCNHLHDFDPAVIIKSFPQAELSFIGKKEIYTTMPFVARAMHKLGCLPIDRENNREAAKTIVTAAKKIAADRCSIGIFPEGYTSKSGELLPFRNGAFKIAYKAKVPIVVCTLHNTPAIVKNLFKRKTIVNLDVLETVTYERMEASNSTLIGNEIFETMQKNILMRRSGK